MPKKPANSKKAPQKKGASSLLATKKATKSTKKSAGLKKSSNTKFKNKKQVQKRLDTQTISELESNLKSKKTWKFWQKWTIWRTYQAWRRDFLSRRPHRSFRLSTRDKSKRSLTIRGYIAFSLDVLRQIKREYKFFLALFAASFLAFVLLSLITPQATYNNLREALNESMQQGNIRSGLYRSGLLFISSFSSGGTSQLQEVFIILTVIFIWLVTVYFLRHRISGGAKVKLGDVAYRAGAPLLSTLFLLFWAIIQALPLGLYIIIFSSAKTTDVLNGGAGEMLAVLSGVLIATLVIYWLTSTLLALVVVTIPGTRPMQALQVADDMVLGRRGRIVRRLLWHCLQMFMLWVIILLPIIYLENRLAETWLWLKSLPIVPISIASMTIVSVIWTSVYLYMLYRKVLDDQSSPA